MLTRVHFFFLFTLFSVGTLLKFACADWRLPLFTVSSVLLADLPRFQTDLSPLSATVHHHALNAVFFFRETYDYQRRFVRMCN